MDLLNKIIRFGYCYYWSSGTQQLSGYLNVEVTDYQVHLLNTRSFDTITELILQCDVGNEYQNNLLQRQLYMVD